MASTDALPIARKNVAFRVTFPILDADGDLVTGATGLDSEVSLDGASFADCTNEATEIGSSGMYYLDLTSGEMNGDCVAVIVKTSTSGAKTVPMVFYPAEDTELRANAVLIESADPTDTIRDAVVDDATRIDASALNTASVTSIPAILVDTGTTLQAELDGIQADTEDIQARLPTALVGGRMDSSVEAVNGVEIVGDGDVTPWGPA